MKKVILKSLTLCNFKGEQSRTTHFNADVTTISGANGIGKSRHFDAFMWLLFGKDVQDRKDYEVRTRNADGTLLHEAECSVTGVLDIDGREITLKRESSEKWVKPRSQTEKVLKGNDTLCWWNETPINVSEYDARVAGILEASLFKMITNPMFFANMDWKLQRAELINMAGTMSDAEIAATNPDFQLLLDKLTDKSLSDYRKEVKAKKEKLNKQLAAVPVKIKQTRKLTPVGEDFGALETEIKQIDQEIAEIDKILSDNAARIRAEYQAEQAKQRRVADLKSQRDNLIREAEQAAKNAAFESNATRRELESGIASKKRELSAMERTLKTLQSTRDRYAHEVDDLEVEIVAKRKEWEAENAKQYAGDDVCHHCGQILPEEKRAKNLADFKESKKAKKNAITKAGQALAARQEAAKNSGVNTEKEIAEQEAEIAKVKADIKASETTLAGIPENVAAMVIAEEVVGWRELTNQIEEAESALATSSETPDDTESKTRKQSLKQQRDSLIRRLAVRDEIAKNKDELVALEEEGKQLAQQVADLEKEEYTIQEFTRTKIDECESRINNLFHEVTFRLFDKTFEGNIFDTCVPLIKGVPFGSANTAGKINAGLDIINTLCRFHGICAPIFIDNRESVNELLPTESQIINLVVTTDKKLTIE